MASAQSVLRSKPDLKEAGITLAEAGGFAGLIITTDFVDEQNGFDQDTLKSASNAVPIALSLVSTAGVVMTKGGTQRAMRDLQLMSTPFAAISITRVLRARGVFGRFFKKKAKHVDNKGFGHKENRNVKHESIGPRAAMEMSFSGPEAA